MPLLVPFSPQSSLTKRKKNLSILRFTQLIHPKYHFLPLRINYILNIFFPCSLSLSLSVSHSHLFSLDLLLVVDPLPHLFNTTQYPCLYFSHILFSSDHTSPPSFPLSIINSLPHSPYSLFDRYTFSLAFNVFDQSSFDPSIHISMNPSLPPFSHLSPSIYPSHYPYLTPTNFLVFLPIHSHILQHIKHNLY
jgi:hypothetical protein